MKKVIITSGIIILLILLFFGYYLVFIKSHIVGSYIPSDKDCKRAYDCVCVSDSCLCSYKYYFKENRLTCSKELLRDSAIKK